jgi:hypothetical protein
MFLLGDRLQEMQAEPWTYVRAVGDPPLGF